MKAFAGRLLSSCEAEQLLFLAAYGGKGLKEVIDRELDRRARADQDLELQPPTGERVAARSA